MGIIKNEIPILEFDSEQTAVISPVHENLNLNLPKKCVFAFLGNYIDEYANSSDTKQVSTFISATKNYPIYITKYKGEEIVLCQAPVGAAAAAQILDWLIGYGVCEIISAGSCGALEHFEEVHSLFRAKHCVTREHRIITLLLHALWKSTKEQKRPLKKQYLSTT